MKELLEDWKPLLACFGLAVLVWFLVKERTFLNAAASRSSAPPTPLPVLSQPENE